MTIYRFTIRRLVPVAVMLLAGCHAGRDTHTDLTEVAANEEVARYLKAFEGRGALSDDSKPTPAGKALTMFHYPDDLRLDLVAAEPDLSQPVFINFDHRGRLWVVQYNQYPYPEGLKITGIDNHLRVTFDKIPSPPPSGAKGADKITFFEDTDGDGKYDKATDAITGLNIATSVTLGRGRIWVLSPPYLLAYPDPDGDGLPDGEPEVHLKGFGLEDTHAVANSLRWGPDGWLYGAQGSTTTANVSSGVTKNVAFSGQAIWRYHPETKVFEIFAEGGGNTFCVEMDSKGRVYSGDNGYDRGQYYKQGGYYIKNWGKHGALTNKYAFGNLPNMRLTGEKIRFTHAWIKYEGGSLPERYRGEMIAVNPLQSYVQLTRLEPNGSTFATIDEARILETGDRWFRPVDIKAGPDGAVYIADWYDSRLSHVDPRDTWDKSSGRIYRLHAIKEEKVAPFDLSTWSGEQLIGLLSSGNKWFRQQALRQLGDRKDASLLPELRKILQADTGQLALEALWAINLCGGFDEATAKTALLHSDPFVRMWGVRLLGDAREVSPGISGMLAAMAAGEPHPEVRSQLASSAKRLPAPDAIPIVENLLLNHDDSGDPDIPLLIWWALESKAGTARDQVVAIFKNPEIWDRPVVKQVILKRIMQRYIMEGGREDYLACARLLRYAPSPKQGEPLIAGLQEGLRGSEMEKLPAELLSALKPYQAEFTEEAAELAIRQGDEAAVSRALKTIADDQAPLGRRLACVRIMGEVNVPASVPVLLGLLRDRGSSPAILQAALQSLARYDDAEIGSAVVAAYPDRLRAFPDVRDAALSLFASRSGWARQFLENVGNGKKIHTGDVSLQVVQRLRLLNDKTVSEAVDRLWPGAARLATASEKTQETSHIANLLRSGKGDPGKGHALFNARCGSCHKLFDEGGQIGPDLTGYDRNNVDELLLNIIDPSAYIREGYVYSRILTTDGRHLTGSVVQRHGSNLTIRSLAGEEITIAASQISEMEPQKESIMPERLLNGLTDQEVRDLFAYLTKEAGN